MNSERPIPIEVAYSVGGQLGIDWTKIDLEQFRRGLEVELEHGLVLTGTIAWAHLKEIHNYYTRLD